MASSKPNKSSDSTNSDPSPRTTSSPIRPQPLFQDLNVDQPTTWDGSYDGLVSFNTMTVEGLLEDTLSDPPSTESTLLDGSLNLMDAPLVPDLFDLNNSVETEMPVKTGDEVWREIVSAEGKGMMKEETPDGIMTLEDFLAKTGMEDAVVGESEVLDVKMPAAERQSCGAEGMYGSSQNPFHMIDRVEGSIVAFGNGLNVYGGGGRGGGVRGKRGRLMMLEPLDKAAAQKQRRMIKNRESAARSRERKQGYQMELEALTAQLEQENEILINNIQRMNEERIRKIMESPAPAYDKPDGFLRRTRSSGL